MCGNIVRRRGTVNDTDTPCPGAVRSVIWPLWAATISATKVWEGEAGGGTLLIERREYL